MTQLIKNVHLPQQKGQFDVEIKDTKIQQITPVGDQNLPLNQQTWLLPGLIDLSLHIERSQQASQQAQAAFNQGFNYVCIQPDTQPAIDSNAQVRALGKQNQDKQHPQQAQSTATILPIGALTQELKGEQLANMSALKEAGCVALGHARTPIANAYVMRRAMEYARTFDMLLILSANDAHLAMGGCVHEGYMSTRLGLAGHPEVAETVALAQILLLAQTTGARVHISQISCAKSLIMIRNAQQEGLKVSADVAIANLLYTHEQVSGFNSFYHLQPVLRTQEDRNALLAGVNQGELAICSNHHAFLEQDKLTPFAQAKPGLSVQNEFITLLWQLIEQGDLESSAAFNSTSTLCAEILGMQCEIKEQQTFNGFLLNNGAIKRL